MLFIDWVNFYLLKSKKINTREKKILIGLILFSMNKKRINYI
jgi:hypothetical protein